ncbi:MAG: hypothetical protein V7603_1567 [Micromonosporaceae bacterium]
MVYARVPSDLKDLVDAYSIRVGKTLTAAVVDLLRDGLGAESYERTIAKQQASIVRLREEKSKVDAELETVKAQLATLGTLAERAGSPLGTCPSKTCGRPITGHDVLVTGRCPTCGYQLSQIIAPEVGGSTVDNRELFMFLGALGAVVAVAYLAGKK